MSLVSKSAVGKFVRLIFLAVSAFLSIFLMATFVFLSLFWHPLFSNFYLDLSVNLSNYVSSSRDIFILSFNFVMCNKTLLFTFNGDNLKASRLLEVPWVGHTDFIQVSLNLFG